MRILSWLFGKRAETASAPVEDGREKSKPQRVDGMAEQTRTPPHPHELEKPAPANPESENLRRWRDSGQARAWVERRKGCWNHADWLALLDELKRSDLWPMNIDAVGLTLEELKRERPGRN